jgi:hypothetical protein
MGKFFTQFFGFLFFSPLTAAAFGFAIWILPAIFFREQIARLRLRFFHFFVTGYVFIAITTMYLLAVGSRSKSGHRHHEAGPLVGMLASLALAWWLNRLIRKRFPPRQKPGPPGPGPSPYPAAYHPGYGHPGYRPPPPYGPQPGYPPPPGYPGYAPPPSPQQPQAPGTPPANPDPANQPRNPGVPWVVPPPDPPAPTTPTD